MPLVPPDQQFFDAARSLGSMIIKLVVTVMLVWALAPHPYSYYILLRWVVCGAAVFTVIRAAELDNAV
jgi:hypothetical protein